MEEILELDTQEAKLRLEGNPKPAIIDVREPDEFALASIAGAQLIPMQSIPAEFQLLERLADESDLLVICHHGVRSLQVVSWLRSRGLDNCFSLTGGIDRWSKEVDSSVPRY